MSVHYKFKSTLDFDTITFDGLHISVADLKRAIINQKRLGITDFDLQITNAQTKEEYTDDNNLIPKNTSLIIARVPLIHQPKKSWDVAEKHVEPRNVAKPEGLGLDISKMVGSEEDKIQAMMLQSTAEYDPKSYQKIRSQSQTGEVPGTYRCNRCKKGGHWIKNCPFTQTKEFMEIKKNTGIPKSFQNRDEKQEEAEKQEVLKTDFNPTEEIPEDLICSICRDLFTDAVMIPCCGSSFCDDCVRTALLESDDNECPDCKEKGSSPASLIPNRFLRNSVNAFKNATGYVASQVKKVTQKDIVESEKESELLTNEKECKVHAQTETTDDIATAAAITEKENLIEKAEIVEQPAKTEEITENKQDVQGHDDFESDFEDNITVKMPPTQTESHRVTFREKPYNGRSSRLQPPGIEMSPQNQFQTQLNNNRRSPPTTSKRKEWEREDARNRDYRETAAEKNAFETPHRPTIEQPPHPQYFRDIQDAHIRPANPHDVFSMQRMNNVYPHIPPSHMQMNPVPSMQNHHVQPFENYAHMDPRANMSFPHFMRQPFPVVMRPGPPIRRPPGDIRPAIPSNPNLASVYQGVAAKVGTGIIDDPLEVFNRIMKEKEKRKEERRRSPDVRRSRSPERHQRGRYRPSSPDRRLGREAFSRDKRGNSREKRERNDRERDKIKEREKTFRQRRSNSFSDRSSRSRSWSLSPQRRRSRSPLHQRRSRSRPYNTNERLRPDKSHFVRKGEGFSHMPAIQNRKSRSHGRHHPQSHSRKHLAPEDNFKTNLRSPSPQFRRDEDTKTDNSTRRGLENKADTLEPPPPGFESGHYYHWEHGEEKQGQPNVPDNAHKLYDSRRERSLSKSSVRSHNKKQRDHRNSSPINKPSHRKQKDDLVVTHNRTRNDYKSGLRLKGEIFNKRERNYKESNQTVIDKNFINNSLKENVRKLDLIEKHYTNSVPVQVSQTESILSPSSEKEKIIKLNSKIEKRSKERKKKMKKEKTERKKVKKDKKEKRERSKQTSDVGPELDNEESDFSKSLAKDTEDEIPEPEQNWAQEKTDEHEIDGQQKTTNQSSEDFPEDTKITAVKLKVEQNESEKDIGILYDDVCEKLDGDLNKSNVIIEKDHAGKTPPPDFNRFDSVLDIHGYDTDFDDSHTNQKNNKVDNTVPTLSKWELDDPNGPYPNVEDISTQKELEDDTKVTNEVLRKAENAIFARAINAIRPIEASKYSSERSVSRKSNERSPPISVNRKKEGSVSNLKDFQVTVPIGSSQERSVELKPDKSESTLHSPSQSKLHIKDRLGSKIVNKNRLSPQRHAQFQTEEKHRYDHSKDRSSRSDIRSERQNRDKSIEQQSNRKMENKDDKHSWRKVHQNRERDQGKNYDRDCRQSGRGRDKVHDFHKSDARYRIVEQLQDKRQENERDLGQSRYDNCQGMHSKNPKYTENEKTEHRDYRKYTNTKYVENESFNFERNRLVTNPFRKNLEQSDFLASGASEIENKKSNMSKDITSSSGSDTDTQSDDTKRKKKRKDKKEKKRARRSSSMDSTGSARKKHKKKRSKSSKKKKKSKK